MDLIVQPLAHPPVELTFLAARDEEVACGVNPTVLAFAAPWMALAAALSFRLYVRHIVLDPVTLKFADVLVRMGVRIREEVTSLEPGKWQGMLDLRPSRMKGLLLPPEFLPRVLEEIPLLAVLGALASGTTILRGTLLAEVNNRILCRRLSTNLRSLGASVEEHSDGLTIAGGASLRGADLPTGGDPLLGMAMVVAGLAGKGECLVRDVEVAMTEHPAFFQQVFAAQFQRASAAGQE